MVNWDWDFNQPRPKPTATVSIAFIRMYRILQDYNPHMYNYVYIYTLQSNVYDHNRIIYIYI